MTDLAETYRPSFLHTPCHPDPPRAENSLCRRLEDFFEMLQRDKILFNLYQQFRFWPSSS